MRVLADAGDRYVVEGRLPYPGAEGIDENGVGL